MTRPASLVSVSARMAAAVAALLAIGFVLACGDDEEAFAPDTPSTTPEASSKATSTPEPPTAPPTATLSEAILPGGYQFSYPNSWNLAVLSDSPYIAQFFLTTTAKSGEEGFAEFEVWVYENPQNLSLEEFYNGQERPNLFKDAVGGYRSFSAAGVTGYWFDDVLGLTKSTVVTIPSEGVIYEFGDPDQKHQTDGIFSQIVLSFKRVQG